jgi:uncharacterized iron-regulated membrane protein
MTPRRTHRILGITMLLPLLAWAVTGAIFFIKPGYGGAYESLPVRTYPIGELVTVAPAPDWHEVRHVRTILGQHLLARSERGWGQYDPVTGTERNLPTTETVRALIEDALSANPQRYGGITSLEGSRATTNTGATVTLDWNRLSLSQRGVDTDRIDAIYRIHYLQWTGIAWIDRIVGGVGLILLVALSAAGLRLLIRRA